MTSFWKKKLKIIFFSPPGGARELKLRPFDSESKTTSGCSNSLISEKITPNSLFSIYHSKRVKNILTKSRGWVRIRFPGAGFFIFGLIRKSRNKDTIPKIGIFSILATSKNPGSLYNSLNRDFLIFGNTEESRNRDLLKIRIWFSETISDKNWFYGFWFL